MRLRQKQYPGRPLLEHILDWMVTGIIIMVPVIIWNIAYLCGKMSATAQIVAAR